MSGWNPHQPPVDPRLGHPEASPAHIQGNATPMSQPSIGSPPGGQIYATTPYAMTPGGSSFPYPPYNPSASPYNHAASPYNPSASPYNHAASPYHHLPPPAQPEYVPEYTGSDPWKMYCYLRDKGLLDPYWIAWAESQRLQEASQRTLPPSIGRGPPRPIPLRPAAPGMGMGRPGLGGGTTMGAGVRPAVPPPRAQPYVYPDRERRIVSNPTPSVPSPASASAPSAPATSPPPPSPPPQMHDLSRIKEAKAQEYTRALKESRPLNLKAVSQAKVQVRPVVQPQSQTQPRPPSTVQGWIPVQEGSISDVPDVIMGEPGAGPEPTARLDLDAEDSVVYRVAQRGISNEYLASILPPSSDPTPEMSPEETWDTPTGRVKRFFYAEMVFQLKESRDRVLQEKERKRGDGDIDMLGNERAHVDDDEDDEDDDDDDDDDHSTTGAWDEAELWPAEECEKDLADLGVR